MDHQKVARKFIGDWSTRRDGRKTVIDALEYMPRGDAFYVLLCTLHLMAPSDAEDLITAIEARARRGHQTISPVDCNHDHTLCVQSSEGGGPGRPPTSEIVMVCADCGQFCVTASRGDVRLTTTFELPTWPLVDAAARYAWHLQEEEKT